jgi:hypothetical protein
MRKGAFPMDDRNFDQLTRVLGSADSRRGTLQTLSLAMATGLSALLTDKAALAGKGKGKSKAKGKGSKKKPKCKGDQAECGKFAPACKPITNTVAPVTTIVHRLDSRAVLASASIR